MDLVLEIPSHGRSFSIFAVIEPAELGSFRKFITDLHEGSHATVLVVYEGALKLLSISPTGKQYVIGLTPRSLRFKFAWEVLHWARNDRYCRHSGNALDS